MFFPSSFVKIPKAWSHLQEPSQFSIDFLITKETICATLCNGWETRVNIFSFIYQGPLRVSNISPLEVIRALVSIYVSSSDRLHRMEEIFSPQRGHRGGHRSPFRALRSGSFNSGILKVGILKVGILTWVARSIWSVYFCSHEQPLRAIWWVARVFVDCFSTPFWHNEQNGLKRRMESHPSCFDYFHRRFPGLLVALAQRRMHSNSTRRNLHAKEE